MYPKYMCLVTLLALLAATDAAAQTPNGRPQTLQVDLQSIQINRVPPPPAGGYWDGSILGNVFLGSLTGIYPDIEICLRRGAASTCRRVCINAQLYEPEEASDPRIPPTVCKLEVEGRLPIARLTEVRGGEPAREYFDLSVIVNEFDSTLNNEPRRHMGSFSLKAAGPPLLSEPEKCTESSPCKISIPTKTGTFVASFATTVSGVSGTLPPPSLPGPQPNYGGGAPPPRPIGIDDALSDLRDADNCLGTDDFFPRPQGTVFGQWLRRMIWGDSSETDQYYQLAGLVAAIPDPTVRARVQRRVVARIERESGAENIYLSVVADLESSQAWHAAFVEVAKSFAGKLASKGLDKLVANLPTLARPEWGLQAQVERWIYGKLASDALTDRAIDLMFKDSKLTAECVMNELAKQGFREEVRR